LVHRGFASRALPDPTQDPLNRGYLVLGGGEEQTGLYFGDFQTALVLDDSAYYVNLTSVSVSGFAVLPVLDLSLPGGPPSNALVDSGTPGLIVEPLIYNFVIAGIAAHSAACALIMSFPLVHAIPNNDLALTDWPSINFTFAGENGSDVTLLLTPDEHWQVNASSQSPNTSQFAISPTAGLAPQSTSIFGLAMLSGYYTIFDRSRDANGVIKFANKVRHDYPGIVF
jgi:hypothetical protein